MIKILKSALLNPIVAMYLDLYFSVILDHIHLLNDFFFIPKKPVVIAYVQGNVSPLL